MKTVSDPDDEMRMLTEHEESEEVVAPSEETWETIAYDKLVRDRIPEIIRADGAQCETEVLTEEAYIAALDRKIDEELAEYRESQAMEELADLMEVIYTLAAQQGCSAQKFDEIRVKKQQEKGGFSERYFLKTVTKKK